VRGRTLQAHENTRIATVSEVLDAIPDTLEDAARALLDCACAQELTIVTAESCTGGLLASVLTDVEGASHAFERGFVVYTDAAKHELLGVDSGLLERCGAVSKPVAIAMAEGALGRSTGDLAVAVTGFAGPGGPEDECGLVHFACARRGAATDHCEQHFGQLARGPIRLACLGTALEMLSKAASKLAQREPSTA
jgi:nicotinamide-nucleotide amidase